MYESGHLSWKFQVPRYFTFAMARWKLCTSTTFEILPLSTCTLCQQKPNIFNGIQPIFEIIASERRCWGWTFGWKVQGAQVFYFGNGKVKTLHIDNIWNFATFNLYPVRAKILHLQRHSTDFRNICLRSKMLRVDICVESFRCPGILLLPRWKLCTSTTFEILPLSTCTLCGQNPASPKAFNRFSKYLHPLEDVEGRHLCGKFQGAQVFYFGNGKVKTLHIDNIWKFCQLSTCTLCGAKILHLQRHSTDFRNICLRSKMLRVDICVESFRSPGILLLQWQGENFAHRTTFEILPLSTCTLCGQKSNASPKAFNRFSKYLPPLEDVEGGTFVWKVSGAQVFYFCNGKVKTLHIDDIWNFANFQPVHCGSKNPVSPKAFNRFSKSLPQLEDVEGGHLGGKFPVRRCFTFKMGRLKLRAMNKIWNFATFNLHTVPAKTQYLQRYSTDFRNLCLSSKMLRVDIWVESFRCPGILLLQWQGENFAHRQHLKFCHFQRVHCASKNPVSSKGIQPIFEILASARRCWGWAFGLKVSVTQVF